MLLTLSENFDDYEYLYPLRLEKSPVSVSWDNNTHFLQTVLT